MYLILQPASSCRFLPSWHEDWKDTECDQLFKRLPRCEMPISLVKNIHTIITSVQNKANPSDNDWLKLLWTNWFENMTIHTKKITRKKLQIKQNLLWISHRSKTMRRFTFVRIMIVRINQNVRIIQGSHYPGSPVLESSILKTYPSPAAILLSLSLSPAMVSIPNSAKALNAVSAAMSCEASSVTPLPWVTWGGFVDKETRDKYSVLLPWKQITTHYFQYIRSCIRIFAIHCSSYGSYGPFSENFVNQGPLDFGWFFPWI